MIPAPGNDAKGRRQDHEQPPLVSKWLPPHTLSTMPSQLPSRPKQQALPMAGTGHYYPPPMPFPPQTGSFSMPPPMYTNNYQDPMTRRMFTPMATPPPTPQAQREPELELPAPLHVPAGYEFEDPNRSDVADLVGTAAYYKSREFKRKQAAGRVQVPGSSSESEDVDMEDAKPAKAPSLIMIFGRDTVRRLTTNNNFYLRMQRYNKRS